MSDRPHLHADGVVYAIDVGEQGIVDRYLSTRKTEAAAWQRYTEAAQEAQQATSFESLYATGMMDQQFVS